MLKCLEITVPFISQCSQQVIVPLDFVFWLWLAYGVAITNKCYNFKCNFNISKSNFLPLIFSFLGKIVLCWSKAFICVESIYMYNNGFGWKPLYLKPRNKKLKHYSPFARKSADDLPFFLLIWYKSHYP